MADWLSGGILWRVFDVGTLLLIAYLWRLRSRRLKTVLEAVSGQVRDGSVTWSTFIHGRGAACPLCGELHQHAIDFGLRGGLGDHILDEHPDTTLARDVRTIRASRGRVSMS